MAIQQDIAIADMQDKLETWLGGLMHHGQQVYQATLDRFMGLVTAMNDKMADMDEVS